MPLAWRDHAGTWGARVEDRNSQIPPDLVAEFQLIDINLLYAPPLRHVTSCCINRSQSASCIDMPLGGGEKMTPTWAQRQKDLLRDCVVSPDVFHHMVDRLGDFVAPYQHALKTEAGQRNVHLYLQGLLSHLPRKNAEDIATLVDVERLVLQEFIGTAPWDHRPLVHVLVGQVVDQWGEQVPHGWVTGDDELGRHTQFRGELRERGERYVLGVPCNTAVRDLEVPSPAYQGRGRRPKAPWQLAHVWRQSRPSAEWT